MSLLHYYFQFNNIYYCIFVYILVIRYKFNSRCSKNNSNRNIDVSLLRYVRNLLSNELWNVCESHFCTTLHFHLMLFISFFFVSLTSSILAYYKYFSFAWNHVVVTISKALATMVTTHLFFFSTICKTLFFFFCSFPFYLYFSCS